MTGYCDRDSVPLERRIDDNEVTVQQRLIEYEQQIQPLASFFQDMNIRQDVNADAEPAALTAQLCAISPGRNQARLTEAGCPILARLNGVKALQI